MKIVDVSGTITAYDLKVGKYRQLIELMKIGEYSRSKSFYLGPWSFTYEIKTCFNQKPLGHFQPKFACTG